MAAGKKRKLGRGLSGMMGSIAPADLGDAAHVREAKPVVGVGVDGVTVEEGIEAARHPGIEGEARGVTEIEVGRISASPYQPRRSFGEAELAGLAASIRQSGMIQPVLVRPRGDGFELVAGERRWRAAQAAGLERIPAVVRELDDAAAAEAALVENIQRVDLNPIERAHALRSLSEMFGLTHEEVAGRVGLERPTVSNLIRLTELSPGIQELLGQWRLAMGHARALLAVGDLERREALARQAAEEGWSVRRLEEAVKEPAGDAASGEPRAVGGWEGWVGRTDRSGRRRWWTWSGGWGNTWERRWR